MNNLVSAGVGFVPVAGDVVLATFKANSRNAALLEFLRIRGEEYIKLHGERDNGAKKDPSFFKKMTTGGKSEEGNKGSLSKADQEQVTERGWFPVRYLWTRIPRRLLLSLGQVRRTIRA